MFDSMRVIFPDIGQIVNKSPDRLIFLSVLNNYKSNPIINAAVFMKEELINE